MIDFTIENHGSVLLCRCNNEAAREHLVAHVSDEAQWFGDALVVEPRYGADLLRNLEDDGFTTAANLSEAYA